MAPAPGTRLCASCALAVALGLACAASTARAWTRASVEDASAHVSVQASGAAEVELVLGLRVYGGWLSRYEVLGLDPDAVVDTAQTPWLELEDGRRLEPALRVMPGPLVRLDFGEKRDAPRRGLHHLGLRYTTTLHETEAASSGPPSFGFALPAFGVDLDRVELFIDAPAGTQLAARGADADTALTVERSERDGRALLHLSRAHLPRTIAFGAELLLPRGAAAASQARQAFRMAEPSRPAAWAAGCLLALYALKRRAVRSLARSRDASPILLVPLPEPVRVLGACGCGLFAAFAHAGRPGSAALGLVLLVSLQLVRGYRGARTTVAPNTARSRSALSARAAEFFGHAGWLDATTPLGAGLLGSLYALACLRFALGQGPGLWLETLLLATPAWLSATRVQLPRARPLSSAVAGRRAPGRAA